MAKYYFDTSIWIDIYDQRGYNGEVAKQLMRKIILDDDLVLYSDMVIIELKKLGYSEYEIKAIFSIAKPDHLLRVHSTKDQGREARRLMKQREVPFGDALHAVMARDHEAQFISRDTDFRRLKDIVPVKLPEDLIYVNP